MGLGWKDGVRLMSSRMQRRHCVPLNDTTHYARRLWRVMVSVFSVSSAIRAPHTRSRVPLGDGQSVAGEGSQNAG